MKAKELSRRNTRNNKAGKNYTGLHIVKKMMGKMASDVVNPETGKCYTMQSLSTSVLLNERCQERIAYAAANDIDSICLHCFAVSALSVGDKKSDGMARNLENNYKILRSGILNWDDIPVITSDFFRFEAHGDTDSVIQLINYILFCEKALEAGSNTRFAIWTKNPDIFDLCFNTYGIDKPENLQILVSSDMVDKKVELLPEYKAFTDKIFTVYSATETAKRANASFNCCKPGEKGKRCTRCQLCYNKNNVNEINEILR